jgi:SAM-dependent MidA family methyltransferase
LTDAPVGAVGEWSDALVGLGAEVGARLASQGGAALFVDYGRDTPGAGDTLQALRGHRKESPLANPGEADLTVHVDFPAFLAAAEAAGAQVGPIRTQRDFLRALGIEVRAAALARSRPDRAPTIARQLERLIAPDQMGALFKVAVVCQPGLVASGFEICS